ncbi:MAG: hypothetical protein FWH14_04845 [Oscillospiraceae bacterium]|nr:hypothetical protein [Oscillospiraceae bacterium]
MTEGGHPYTPSPSRQGVTPLPKGEARRRTIDNYGEKHPPLRRHPLYERGQGLEQLTMYD